MSSVTVPVVNIFPSHPTAGIRTTVAMGQLGEVIPSLTAEVFQWLTAQGLEGFGPMYIQYNVINMPGMMELEIGWFTEKLLEGTDRIVTGESPAGEYASLRYTGPYEGLYDANALLIGWAKERGIEWDVWDVPEGHAFAGRYEMYLTDPSEEPDSEKWVTEVAIKVKA